MNELSTNVKTVTTKELAETLNIGLTTVKDTVKKLSRVLGSVKKNNQGGYLFTEQQATLIKQEIQNITIFNLVKLTMYRLIMKWN